MLCRCVLILSLLSTGAASQADFFVSVDFLPDAVWINLVLRRVMHLLLAFFGLLLAFIV
jgi:hypothetical protein